MDCSDRMCGGYDCNTCYPGATNPVKCSECEFTCPAWRAADYLVKVSNKRYCKACARALFVDFAFKAHAYATALKSANWLSEEDDEIANSLAAWCDKV